jgi:hypothetical protein
MLFSVLAATQAALVTVITAWEAASCAARHAVHHPGLELFFSLRLPGSHIQSVWLDGIAGQRVK